MNEFSGSFKYSPCVKLRPWLNENPFRGTKEESSSTQRMEKNRRDTTVTEKLLTLPRR